MASTTRPSSRYPSMDSRSSTSSHQSDPSSSSSDLKNPTKNLSSLKRLITNPTGRRRPLDPIAVTDNSSVALARTRSKGSGGQNFGTMVKKFMEKGSNSKPGSADRTALFVPADLIAEDLKKTAVTKGSNFSSLHRKLFQKAGSGDRSTGKVLTDVKTNTRTLAMVLHSERELLSQNKKYEVGISDLRLLIEEKNREVEKLKDLCLKQREEIKALKDAILFPDVMNSQLQELLEKQGSELKHTKQVIPTLQKQVTALTGQIQCLVEDLAEVKADKYAVRTCFDGNVSSPRTPIFDQEAANSLEYSSGHPLTPGSPENMFMKDFNPCLTPCFPKTESKDYDEIVGYDSLEKDTSFRNRELNPEMSFGSRGGKLSKSSEHRQRPGLGNTAQKICKSDEKKWSVGKPTYQKLF